MKNASELLEEWESGDSTGMRPKRVQVLRDDIAAATGLAIPRGLSQIESWLERMHQSGVMTKKLREAAEGTDDPNPESDPPPEDD